VVGDTATLVQNGKPLPGVAQVAIQQGRYVGQLISRKVRGRKAPRPFRYFDKGNMAVVGKNFAIMETRDIRLAGLTHGSPGPLFTCSFCPSCKTGFA
jgi:NADH:ubiquinone reductase (H+-translocating)